MWGVFKVRKEPRPSRWGSFAVKKTIQKGGKSVVITPTQAEVEKAKALVKKKPKQRGKGTKKSTSVKKTAAKKKKKTERFGPPGSGATEFRQQKEKLDELMEK